MYTCIVYVCIYICIYSICVYIYIVYVCIYIYMTVLECRCVGINIFLPKQISRFFFVFFLISQMKLQGKNIIVFLDLSGQRTCIRETLARTDPLHHSTWGDGRGTGSSGSRRFSLTPTPRPSAEVT